jgi:hypothetical protein
MIDEQPRCGNPACGLPIAVLQGHRPRQYCNDACRMAAHRARVIAENQARDAALQLQLALHEREVWRERFGDLLSASLDLLRHLRITYGAALAEQMAAALSAERDEGRKSLVEERATLIDEIMLTGEQVDFLAVVTETFELAPGIFGWSAFCGSASVEQLRLARDAAYLKLQVKRGRLKLAELGSNRYAPGR